MAIKISAVILIAAVAAVQANNVGRAGWSTPAPTTTPAPPPPPPPPSGWAPPPPPPPPSNVTVALSGELAAAGSGWAAENHAETVNVQGGWGVPADLALASGGEAALVQEGAILQVTAVDGEGASSLNTISVAQAAEADESLAVVADGLAINLGQSGWAGAAGEGASAAAGDSSIIVS